MMYEPGHEPLCPVEGEGGAEVEHNSVYRAGHWRCYRCGFHGCHPGDCDLRYPEPVQYVPHGRTYIA